MGRIVVAVDFGTSRTAYATSQEGLEQEDIEIGVPEGAGHVSIHDAKTPTSVLLDPQGRKVVSFGYKAEEEYVTQPENDGLLFQRAKMVLHQPANDEPLAQAANGKKLKLSVLLAKTMEYIKNDVVGKLNQAKGLRVTAADIVWVLTVPAIWNDWAKAMMRGAAYEAGMVCDRQSANVVFALEPECVCISVQAEEALGVIWDVGQKILILDCGGGTVDVTAHEIAATQPLQLKELIVPDGGDLGSTKVDDRFYEFFQELVGSHRFDKLRRATAFLSLARNWEDRKVTFTGKDKEEGSEGCSHISVGDVLLELDIPREEWSKLVSRWNSRHPDRQAMVRGRAGLALSFSLMLSFFQEPVRRIVSKLKEVISRNKKSLEGLDYIVVAGGFARSPVLMNSLRQSFNDTITHIVVSRHPDLAIVRGAAAFGARKSVFQSRKAKYTYGVDTFRLFDQLNPQHMSHSDRKSVASDGKLRLHIFSAHGRIGDDIGTGKKPHSQEYHALTEAQTTVKFAVLVTKSRDVFLHDEKGVQELCHCNLEVDKSLPLEQRRFQVEFSFSGTETKCRFYKFDGREFVHAKELLVTFPREVHWLSRDVA